MTKTATPAYVTFLSTLAPLIADLNLTPVDQGSFIKFEAPNGHKAYVAKQVTAVKRIDSTFPDSCLVALTKKNGKIVGTCPADPQVFANHLYAMVLGTSSLPPTVRQKKSDAPPIDIMALMAQSVGTPEPAELVLNDELEDEGDLDEEAGSDEV
jgi:hypothetical protein